MTKAEILQNLSADFSKMIKEYVSIIKKMDGKDKNELMDLIKNFKNGLDDLTENTNLNMKRSELRHIIKEELQLFESKKIPKKDTPEWHEHKVAIDTVKNPNKGLFMGGLSAKEAEETLRKKFNYSDKDIEKLKK